MKEDISNIKSSPDVLIAKKHIAKKLELSDKMEHLARNPTFITLKDHKENFNLKLSCRLINPSKSELGK